MPPPQQAQMLQKLPHSEWGQLHSELIWIYEGLVPEHHREMNHHFPGQSGILMLEGDMQVKTERGHIRAGAGQWIFPRQGDRLQILSPDCRVLSVHFHLYWPGGQSLFEFDVAEVLSAADYPNLEVQVRKLLRAMNRVSPGAKNQLPWAMFSLETHLWTQRFLANWIYVYVTTLLERGVTPTRLGHVDHRVLEVLRRLDRAPLNVPLLEKEIAAAAGLSISHLDRLFARQFGTTPRQYFERRRLEAAIAYVQGSSMSMKQIAYVLGFSTLAYFSRWFRQRTGTSPRNFQKEGMGQYKTDFLTGLEPVVRIEQKARDSDGSL